MLIEYLSAGPWWWWCNCILIKLCNDHVDGGGEGEGTMANICSHCSHSPLSDKNTTPAIGTRAPSNRPTNQTEQVQMFAKWQRNSGPKQQPEPQTCRSNGKGCRQNYPLCTVDWGRNTGTTVRLN